jgi:predicted amidohydrolase
VRTPLRIAVAQSRCFPDDLGMTVKAHAAQVRSAEARVVLFPELSLTGYELEAAPPALDDDTLAPLVDACAAAGAVALVGAPVAGDAGQVFIGVLAVDGDGATVAYRKVNLGEQEAVRFTPGPGPAAIEVDGWRLGLAICKDTGIPEHAAGTAALGVDAYLAGVLEHAADTQVTDRRGHRIATTHHLWVAISSFAGSTGGGYTEAAGRSAVWRPDGTVVARAGNWPGSLVCASLT